MAKQSLIQRELKREKIVKQFAERRAELKRIMSDSNASPEERMEARQKFNSLPRNSSPCRLMNRCRLTGRPHGYYRKFGLSRSMLRIHTMNGDVPGVRKASW
jgi:small subunit ribosomal protein S14